MLSGSVADQSPAVLKAGRGVQPNRRKKQWQVLGYILMSMGD